MQIIKAAGLTLVALCAICTGGAMAMTLTERVKALETALAALESFGGELSYSLAPPDEIVSRLAGRETLAKADYLSACKTFCGQGMPFPVAWRKAVLEHGGHLSKADAQTLSDLSDTLGRCDLDEELAALSRARQTLSRSVEEAREYARTHGKLYRTLGMLSGAFLVILWL